MPFDPSQPFDVVQPAARSAPQFDPSQPFEAPDSSTTAQPEAQSSTATFDPSKPFEAAAPAGESTAGGGSDVDAQGSDIDQLAGKRHEFNVSDQELEYIAAKHGIPRQYLQDAVGWYGGLHQKGSEIDDGSVGTYLRETGKLAAGEAMNMIGMGVPQGLYKKFATPDEQHRRALDDLEHLLEERKPGALTAAEMAAGLVVPAGFVGKGAGAAAHIAEGAAVGSAVGYAHSNEDNELSSALFGAGLGAGIGAAATGLSKLASRRAARIAEAVERAAPGAGEDAGREAAQAGARTARDSVEQAQQEMTKYAQPEQELERAVVDTPAVRQAVAEGDVQKFVEATTPQQRAAIAELSNASPQAAAIAEHGESTAHAWRVTRDAVEQLESRMAGDVEGAAAREGVAGAAGDLRDTFRGIRHAEYLSDAIVDRGAGKGFTGVVRAVKDTISDLRYVTGSMDRRLGTRITPVIDRLSGAFNKFSNDYVEAAQRVSQLNTLLIRAERDPAPMGGKFSLYDALQEPAESAARYTQKQQAAIAGWRQAFEEARQKAVALGLPVQKLEGGNYVPHLALDPVKYVLEMDRMSRGLPFNSTAATEVGQRLLAAKEGDRIPIPTAVQDEVGKVLAAARQGVEAGASATPQQRAAAEYALGLEYSTGAPARTVEQFLKAQASLGDLQRVSSALSTRASASFRRAEQALPRRLLETDTTKLWMKWNHNTFRHARLRGTLQELRSAAAGVRAADPKSAEYLDRLVRDLVGTREGTVAAAQGRWLAQKQLQWARYAESLPAKSPKRLGAQFMARLPEAFMRASHNIYPYTLGMRPAKVIENLTSPALVGIPSTGARQAKYWLGGMGDFARAAARSPLKTDLEEQLVARGLMPKDQPLEAHRWMTEGLERSLPKQYTRQAMAWLADKSLMAYRRTDAITRAITLRAAERMAADLPRDARLRADLFEKMGHGYAAEVGEALERGDSKAAADHVANWLNGYTQFNYNRASMSEYGRVMGGLFSTFTKWPTSVVGEALERVEAGHSTGRLAPELRRLAFKYLGPVVALRIVGAGVMAAEGYGPDEIGKAAVSKGGTWTPAMQDASPTTQWAVGQPDRWTPIGSVDGLLDNPFTSAPVPHIGAGLLKSVVAGDAMSGVRAAGQGAMMLAPGNWMLRFYYQDLPEIEGEGRPTQRTEQLLLDDLTDN